MTRDTRKYIYIVLESISQPLVKDGNRNKAYVGIISFGRGFLCLEFWTSVEIVAVVVDRSRKLKLVYFFLSFFFF